MALIGALTLSILTVFEVGDTSNIFQKESVSVAPPTQPPFVTALLPTLLIAPFSGPELLKYRVTETLTTTISNALNRYDDLLIQVIDAPITIQQGAQEARRIARERGAVAIVWGWYGVTDSKAVASVHVELGEKADPQVKMCIASLGELAVPAAPNIVSGQLRVSPRPTIESMEFQLTVGEEMAGVALLFSGLSRLAVGDYLGAVGRFSDIDQQFSRQRLPFEMTDVYFYRAIAKHGLGDSDSAVNDLDRAIALNKDLQKARFVRAAINFDRNEYRATVADLNQVNSMESNAWVPYLRGSAEVSLSNYREALADSEKVVALSSDDWKGYELRGRAKSGLSNFQGAIADFNEADKHGFSSSCRLFYRGWAYMSTGLYREAHTDFSESFSLSPNANAELGMAYLDFYNGNYDSAIERAHLLAYRNQFPDHVKALRGMIDKALTPRPENR